MLNNSDLSRLQGTRLCAAAATCDQLGCRGALRMLVDLFAGRHYSGASRSAKRRKHINRRSRTPGLQRSLETTAFELQKCRFPNATTERYFSFSLSHYLYQRVTHNRPVVLGSTPPLRPSRQQSRLRPQPWSHRSTARSSRCLRMMSRANRVMSETSSPQGWVWPGLRMGRW